MNFVDTHCHIHEAAPLTGDQFVSDKWVQAGFTNPTALITSAVEAGVTQLLCVGTTLRDSKMAIELASKESNCFATIGIHPHEAKDHLSSRLQEQFAALATMSKVVAVGECGLDYYYSHSPKNDQRKILEFQLQLAQEHRLPLIFHIRDAFVDFWPIFDQFAGLQGVVHSFTANTAVLEQALSRGLYIGLNGIMTFTKDQAQLEAAKVAPLNNLLLETDAPFLTPHPFRGKICQPKHIVRTAEFLSELRGEPLATIASKTTQNALKLFKLKEKDARRVG